MKISTNKSEFILFDKFRSKDDLSRYNITIALKLSSLPLKPATLEFTLTVL
eukprot:m.284062 g.284062  ORF g.284062 m.284062 type:complete len:51 (+) comp40675_c0_seq26:474-626(+)